MNTHDPVSELRSEVESLTRQLSNVHKRFDSSEEKFNALALFLAQKHPGEFNSLVIDKNLPYMMLYMVDWYRDQLAKYEREEKLKQKIRAIEAEGYIVTKKAENNGE